VSEDRDTVVREQQPSTVARPRTSTRDPEVLRARLQAWLETKLPAGAAPRVPAVTAPDTNGLSSETLLFDASWRVDGVPRVHQLVARMAPDTTAVPVFPRYNMHRQFLVMRGVREYSDVPVPQVLWSEPDADPLGAPFFVMERIAGKVPPDLMPYNFDSWVTAAGEHERAAMQESSLRVLAGLHRIAQPTALFSFLGQPANGNEALQRHVAEQWDYYQWASDDGVRSPLIERTFDRLRDTWPAETGPAVLSWGDARIGNILYREFSAVAVLDWEMAALGVPEIDIAWFFYLHRFFEDIAAGYGLPGLPTFLRRDDVAARYADLTGYQPRDLDFFTMYAALRHAIIMFRIHRRTVHFGEATMPADPDDMITHRASLEAMLEGTYWDRVGQPLPR
jgi:aminoglycoside phosphotransferase (APT) family kinase protein